MADDHTDTKWFCDFREDQKVDAFSFGPGLFRLVGPKGHFKEIYGSAHEMEKGHARVRHLSVEEEAAIDTKPAEVEATKHQNADQ